MLEGDYLRQAAGRLRNRVQSATPGVLRDLLALAEYYDDMAADIEPPVPLAPAAC